MLASPGTWRQPQDPGRKVLERLAAQDAKIATLALLMTFWVLPGLVTILTPLRYRDVILSCREALVTAFAGAFSSLIVRKLGKSERTAVLVLYPMLANLLIMVTKGTDGFLDVLRGTTTEQVLRKAPCPVLSVPASF